MIVDSSAIVALVLKESGYERVRDKLSSAESIGIGTPTLVELTLVLTEKLERDARSFVARLLQETGMIAIPFGLEHWQTAVLASMRYGRGRHPARLSFGACLSYATAKLAEQPLLCVGNDFAQTDIQLA